MYNFVKIRIFRELKGAMKKGYELRSYFEEIASFLFYLKKIRMWKNNL